MNKSDALNGRSRSRPDGDEINEKKLLQCDGTDS
jgi:hypothetical protein